MVKKKENARSFVHLKCCCDLNVFFFLLIILQFSCLRHLPNSHVAFNEFRKATFISCCITSYDFILMNRKALHACHPYSFDLMNFLKRIRVQYSTDMYKIKLTAKSFQDETFFEFQFPVMYTLTLLIHL